MFIDNMDSSCADPGLHLDLDLHCFQKSIKPLLKIDLQTVLCAY